MGGSESGSGDRRPGIAADFEGKVVSILDGDTIEVLHDKKPERIRLYGIDCPEKRQPFGQKSILPPL
jgi:endonuclease YncB( thermonuclease family)